ncbi:MAG: polyhydroxyalkanoic acid system family protein [Xanthomonadales bacterium]|nr:polyhydroxyalkanoic acid system family protein [Xanthomonadales bacterium]
MADYTGLRRRLAVAYMSRIDLSAHHSMSHAEAQGAADDLANDLAAKFDIDYGWENDTIHFERSGVQGRITVQEKEIRVQAELGLLLSFLKGRIEEEVVRYLESHFGCTFDA